MARRVPGIPAPPRLERFVESVWTHHALSLAFSCRRDAAGRPLGPSITVIGPKTRPHIFPFESGRELAAVRGKLEWCAPLLDLEPRDHDDAERQRPGMRMPARTT